jgi:transposase
MKPPEAFAKIFLYKHPVDMRRGRSGLVTLVMNDMQQSLFGNSLFLFVNRPQTILKGLYWDNNGFAIWCKALEKETYRWPTKLFCEEALELSAQKVSLLLAGVDVSLLREHRMMELSDWKC